MMVHVISWRWDHRVRAWQDSRAWSYVLPQECLLFVAQWTAGQTPWQRPEQLTPRHRVV